PSMRYRRMSTTIRLPYSRRCYALRAKPLGAARSRSSTPPAGRGRRPLAGVVQPTSWTAREPLARLGAGSGPRDDRTVSRLAATPPQGCRGRGLLEDSRLLPPMRALRTDRDRIAANDECVLPRPGVAKAPPLPITDSVGATAQVADGPLAP